MSDPEARLHVNEHIAWLAIFVEDMTADNWRDMRLRASRQLAQLQTDLAKERGAA